MTILSIQTDFAGQVGATPRTVKILSTDTLAQVTSPGYLQNPINGISIAPTDNVELIYGFANNAGTLAYFQPSISNSVITLNLVIKSNLDFTVVKTVTASALASAGKVNIVTSPSATAQYAVMDIKVFKSTGLSGNSGDRLLVLTDGTIVFNNAGITAALLGTPVFSLWGASGNPVTGSSAASISTAGANIYLQYSGGTLDYSAGSVIVAVTLSKVTL